jgi:hypothetical protein
VPEELYPQLPLEVAHGREGDYGRASTLMPGLFAPAREVARNTEGAGICAGSAPTTVRSRST